MMMSVTPLVIEKSVRSGALLSFRDSVFKI